MNRKMQTLIMTMLDNLSHLLLNFNYVWAGPGGTAIPGRPVAEMEQAPKQCPFSKISLTFWTPDGGRIRC